MIALPIFIVVIILVIYVFSFYSVSRHYLKTKTVVFSFLCETHERNVQQIS